MEKGHTQKPKQPKWHYNATQVRHMVNAMRQCHEEHCIIASLLDPWIYLVAIPRHNVGGVREAKLLEEAEQAIYSQHEVDFNDLFQLDWRQITELCVLERPSHLDWANSSKELFEAINLSFFVHLTSLREFFSEQIEGIGYHVKSSSPSTVTANDGVFEHTIELTYLVAKAVWTANPLSSVMQRALQLLPATFRRYHAVYRALSKRFPLVYLGNHHGQVVVKSHDINGQIDYQRIAHGLNFTKQSEARWLSRITLTDALKYDGTTTITLRSPSYLKARPKALHRRKSGYLIVPERDYEGRLYPISKEALEPVERIEHYIDEARRSLSTCAFHAHAIAIDSHDAFVVALIGSQIASIAWHPGLVKGALAELNRTTGSVKLVAQEEDIIVIASPQASKSLIATVQKKARIFFMAISSDGSDTLTLNQSMNLALPVTGRFQIKQVPSAYFDIMETAYSSTLSLASGRTDFLKGLAFELIGEWDLALSCFQKAYQFNSNDGEINHAISRIWLEKNEYERALVFLQKAHAALPNDPEIANLLGCTYLALGNFENAVSPLEKAAQLLPHDSYVLLNLGKSYMALSRIDDAEATLKNALKHTPHLHDAQTLLDEIGAQKSISKNVASQEVPLTLKRAPHEDE